MLDISGEDRFWKFCGDIVGDDENLLKTAKRRAKEELNIDIEVIDQEPYILHTKKPGDEDTDVILVHFLCKKNGEIRLGEDVREWAWHDTDNLPENLAPNIVPVLKYFAFITS